MIRNGTSKLTVLRVVYIITVLYRKKSKKWSNNLLIAAGSLRFFPKIRTEGCEFSKTRTGGYEKIKVEVWTLQIHSLSVCCWILGECTLLKQQLHELQEPYVHQCCIGITNGTKPRPVIRVVLSSHNCDKVWRILVLGCRCPSRDWVQLSQALYKHSHIVGMHIISDCSKPLFHSPYLQRISEPICGQKPYAIRNYIVSLWFS